MNQIQSVADNLLLPSNHKVKAAAKEAKEAGVIIGEVLIDDDDDDEEEGGADVLEELVTSPAHVVRVSSYKHLDDIPQEKCDEIVRHGEFWQLLSSSQQLSYDCVR